MFSVFDSFEEAFAVSRRILQERRNTAEILLTAQTFSPDDALPAKGYSEPLERLLAMPAGRGDPLLAGCAFGIWLESLGLWLQRRRAERNQGGPGRADPLPPPLEIALLQELAASPFLREEQVPPLIRARVPPTYRFRRAYDRRYRRDRTPTRTYETAVETALASMAAKAPEIRGLVAAFVSNVLILEGVDWRSCSANRYLGLVILSTADQSLIDLEESIVHELGHQILYCLHRLEPLFREVEGEEDMVLPWSGSRRDFFGFFHAAFIYQILRDYYALSLDRRGPLQDEAYCRQRLAAIQEGLERALPMMEARRTELTARGQAILDALARRARARPRELAA